MSGIITQRTKGTHPPPNDPNSNRNDTMLVTISNARKSESKLATISGGATVTQGSATINFDSDKSIRGGDIIMVGDKAYSAVSTDGTAVLLNESYAGLSGSTVESTIMARPDDPGMIEVGTHHKEFGKINP